MGWIRRLLTGRHRGAGPSGELVPDELVPDGRPAAVQAAAAVELVRDDPAGRLALARRTAGLDLDWARAELGFLGWEVERGVLARVEGDRPGSPWWRGVNDTLLRDAAEATLLHQGAPGEPSKPAVVAWLAFLRSPAPAAWYHAHNRSIVAGYVDHAADAALETPAEQLLMNLTLMRVLYAQALEDDMHLGLGLLAPLGRLLADPRACGVSTVVGVPDLYPRRYPLDGVEAAALDHRDHDPEDELVALLDDRVVFPHLARLYEHAAQVLDAPPLAELEAGSRGTYPAPLLGTTPRQRADAVVAASTPPHHDLPWVCAQRWERVLFLSWEVPVEQLRTLVPAPLELDLLDGTGYVSVLALEMAHVHLRDLPGMPGLTNFPELNVRTYVRHAGVPGVFFFSLDAPSRAAVWIGRHVFHVRYDTADLSMATGTDGRTRFTSARHGADARFDATYAGAGPAVPAAPGSIELFLCERYAMFGQHADGSLLRGDIRHSPWQLRPVEAELTEQTVLAAAGLVVSGPPAHTAYSDATDNVVWPMLPV